jgi:transcriptional regulator with XRE-family HTH domain
MPTSPDLCSTALSLFDLKALYVLRNNIAGLLTIQRRSQSALARAVMGDSERGRKDKSWINKFLNGTREIQLKDLDAIAQFFGVQPYQLFQPGTIALTERRSGRDRRRGQERRMNLVGRVRGIPDVERLAASALGQLEHELTHPPRARKPRRKSKKTTVA